MFERLDLPGSQAIYTPEQVRARDQHAITRGVAGYELMERAAAAALSHLRARWPAAQRPLFVCGGGNNGGDGLVMARLALDAGLAPTVVALVPGGHLTGDAARAWEDLRGLAGVPVQDRLPAAAPPAADVADVVVDALFGTGLSRPLKGRLAEAVRWINDAGLPVLAVDVPSGLCSATGRVLGEAAVRADLTVTFVGRKIGHYLGGAPDHLGSLYFDDLGVDELLQEPGEHVARWLAPSLAMGLPLAPPRARTAHKGRHGHVLVVGGAPGTSGAVRLAAEAALHGGAGLVTVATAPEHAAWMNVGRPELMCVAIRDSADLAPLLARADVVVAGPGLGQGAWSRELLAAVLASGGRRVLDADALNLLAQGAVALPPAGAGALHTILTPHPGEAGRLLGVTAGDVQADRLQAVAALVQRWGCVCVLKGAGTLIGAPGHLPHVCDRGTPALAVAGTGDVLAGVMGALWAQAVGRGDALAVACCAVMVHALAGEAAAAAQGGDRGLLAGELAPWVRRVVNGAAGPDGP